MKRRSFLQHMGLLGAGMGLGGLAHLPWAMAQEKELPGYRALVCVFLYGGADTHNLLVPMDNEPWQIYRQRRGNLAVERARLLPLSGTDEEGMAFGLHPGCEELQQLFAGGELAFVRNVGALRQPTTLEDIRRDQRILPAQLFSHSDQQIHWMRGEANRQSAAGWGGRLWEMMQDQAGSSSIPPTFSLGFTNPWQTGLTSSPFILSREGVIQPVESYTAEHTRVLQQQYRQLLQQAGRMANRPLQQVLARRVESSLDNASELAGLLEAQEPLNTAFPDTPFAANLAMVARTIALRNQLGHTRQLFFVGLGGWDTHDRQLQDFPPLISAVSQGLGALNRALKELGVFEQVAVFTAADFGRTLTSNGDGSDHGWGSHHMVMSGALSGGALVGRFPQLAANGPDDFGAGRLLPALASQQYQATLARWFGLPESQLTELFPDLHNFDRHTLGFLPA